MAAKFPGDGAGIIDRARAEDDARGDGKFKFDGIHGIKCRCSLERRPPARLVGGDGPVRAGPEAGTPPNYNAESFGKMLLNFTLKRGSAIMGATASRQTG